MTEQGREEQASAVPPRAGRRRRWPLLAGVGVVVVTSMLALLALDRPAASDSRYLPVDRDFVLPQIHPDPLRAELLRCRALPPQVDDPRCRAAWDVNRRRFFGEAGEYNGPASEPEQPDTASPLNSSALNEPDTSTPATAPSPQAQER